jgi:hypothetical protein
MLCHFITVFITSPLTSWHLVHIDLRLPVLNRRSDSKLSFIIMCDFFVIASLHRKKLESQYNSWHIN